MRAEEFTRRPHLYLDMDGVQADFFTAWARLFGQERYKDIGDKPAREASIQDLSNRGPEFVERFFATLPVLPSFAALLSWLKSNDVDFTVLSAPLRGNHEASIRGKLAWLDRHNPGTSARAIFTGDKQRYAVTQGQPNVLVDDFKKYIAAWRDAGGIGILHRDNNLKATLDQLARIYGTDQEAVDEARGPLLKTYAAKVQLRQPGYKNIIDTTVQARNPEMARRLLRQQYGSRNVIVGQPREIK
jgi:hypothetical protein